MYATECACSSITVGKQAYIDMAFCTQNDSYNNILKFGRPDGEHIMYINEFALFVAQLPSCSPFPASVWEMFQSLTDTPLLRAVSSQQGLIVCVFPTTEQNVFSLCTILHGCILGS
jgi:hypothetical protein